MSFVYNHRPAFYGTIRLHDSNGVFAFHTYLLEAKDTWMESDMDIKLFMLKNNTTKTLQDYADELGFNIISGDAGSYNGGSYDRGATLAAYQITLDSGVEVSDLSSLENISVRSGLSAIPTGEEPVEVKLDDQNTKIYSLGRKVQVRLYGTVNHDPDKEVLIVRNNRYSYQRESGSDWYGSAFGISGTYNYGSEIVDALQNRTSATSGVGLIFTGDTNNGTATENWNPRNAAVTGGGTWKCRGGVIQTNKMINFAGTLNVVGTSFVATHKSGAELEWRNPFGNSSSSFQGSFYKMYIVDPQFQPVLEFKGGGLAEVFSPWWEKEIYNLDVSTNATDVDIAASARTQDAHHDWHIINSASGSDIKHMWRKTTGSQNLKGNVFVKREVAVNIKDGSGAVVEGCQVYVIDNPSDYAKDATFPNNIYTTSPTHSRASITDGYITYNYADPVEYLEETDANGDTPTMKILISTSMHNALPNVDPDTITEVFPDWDGSTFANYENRFQGGAWKESDGQRLKYSDWDTDRFGGYFKVDRRGNDNTNADLFTFKFCSYGHNLAATTTTLKGLDTLNINWTLFDDLSITDSKASTDAYTEINTSPKFYDKAKAYLVENYSGEISTIVNRSGNEINAGSYNVHINKNAVDVFSFDGTTITIKTATFVGDIITTGTTTVEGDEVVIGNFGSIGVLPWKIKNIEATSRIQLYNVTQDTEVLTQKLTGTAGAIIDADGTYASSQIAVGDIIRLRVTCVVGDSAMLPVETSGVATTVGLNFSIDQKEDAIYNSNAIDGGLIDTFTADFNNAPMGVDLSETDGVATVQEIYAFIVYSQTTADGVDKWFNVIRAIDGSNYQINNNIADIKIQNIGTQPVNITGGRLFREDGASVLYAEQGNFPITLDTGSLVANIQPQVESGLNANSKITSINNNCKIIPGLL